MYPDIHKNNWESCQTQVFCLSQFISCAASYETIREKTNFPFFLFLCLSEAASSEHHITITA